MSEQKYDIDQQTVRTYTMEIGQLEEHEEIDASFTYQRAKIERTGRKLLQDLPMIWTNAKGQVFATYFAK